MKKLYQKGWDRINEIAQERAKENKIENKFFQNIFRVIAIFSFIVVPLLPFVLSEETVANCTQCQDFIAFMSLYIPGIKVMAGATSIPQTVSLVVALAWIAIIALSVSLSLGFIIIRFSYLDILSNRKLFLLIYFGIGFFLAGEFGFIESRVSLFEGTVGLFHEDSRRNLTHHLIQSKTGLSFFIFMEIFYMLILIVGWVNMNLGLLGKLFKKDVK